MSRYLFVLGKDRDLSLAELRAVYPSEKFSAPGRETAVLDLNGEFTQVDLNRLGGVIKVARLVDTVNSAGLLNALAGLVAQRYADKKINYGLSVYDWPESKLKALLIGLKKALKEMDIKSRFANQDFQNLSAAQYKGFGEGDLDMLIARNGNELLLGETVAVQDIDAYSKRDYEKPFRSMRVGMLPPKLAQMLINLTGSRGTVWDPFCGGGTLLMEALLMGRDAMGSDIDAGVLEGARKNVAWVQHEFGAQAEADLFVHDATQVLKGKAFEAIACEGYLGPPQERPMSAAELEPVVARLEKLYAGFFQALRAMKFAGPVVIALPFFRVQGGGELFLDSAIGAIEKLGFRRHPETLKYARADQLVGRAIYRFNVEF